MKTARFFLSLALVLGVFGCGRPSGEGGDGSRKVLQNKGSDTLVNVAQAWADAYQRVNPSVAIAVTGGGSGTGIAALINGTVDIANSSRQLSGEEVALAQQNNHNPKEHTVGYDALAVYVHRDNPLAEVSMAQLAAIYGENGTTTKWSELGVAVPGCDSDEIIRVSRQNNSGTYEYFREAVLGEQDFKQGSLDMHGSKDVVDLVQNTACAIGYSGLAYKTEAVKMLSVSIRPGEPAVTPTEDAALDGTYPIARPLFMYTDGEPQNEVKAYLDWILSDVGQCIIKEKGYSPVRKLACASDTPAADTPATP